MEWCKFMSKICEIYLTSQARPATKCSNSTLPTQLDIIDVLSSWPCATYTNAILCVSRLSIKQISDTYYEETSLEKKNTSFLCRQTNSFSRNLELMPSHPSTIQLFPALVLFLPLSPSGNLTSCVFIFLRLEWLKSLVNSLAIYSACFRSTKLSLPPSVIQVLQLTQETVSLFQEINLRSAKRNQSRES